jgi:hypothetical protein
MEVSSGSTISAFSRHAANIVKSHMKFDFDLTTFMPVLFRGLQVNGTEPKEE